MKSEELVFNKFSEYIQKKEQPPISIKNADQELLDSLVTPKEIHLRQIIENLKDSIKGYCEKLKESDAVIHELRMENSAVINELRAENSRYLKIFDLAIRGLERVLDDENF